MRVTYGSTVYECNVAVKCESDKYIKLYNENGEEIAAFYGIADFSKYTISGGSFVSPNDCVMPIPLTAYAIGGRTIGKNSWTNSNGRYSYEIEHELFSANSATCNILLFFVDGTELEYEAAQENGKIILYTDAKPETDIVIDSIQITRV